MAIAAVANRGSASGAASFANIAVTFAAGASIALGNRLIVVLTGDNSNAAGSTPFTGATVTDATGNVWSVVGGGNRTAGAVANDGSSLMIMSALVQFPYANGASVTFNWPVATTNRIANVHEFSGVQWINSGVVVTNTANGGNTVALTSPSVVPLLAGQLVFTAVSYEAGASTIGNDADGIQGAWAATTTSTVGAGATGQMQGYSYKVVSGTASQQWNVTGGGAADWVAAIFVMGADVSADASWIPGNPNYPCLAGFEGLPLETTTVPVDTGTEYYLRHTLFPDNVGTQSYTANGTFVDPGLRQMKTVAFDLFLEGNEDVIDEPITVTLPLRRADLANGATTSSGTALAALQAQGGAYVILDGTTPNPDYVQLWFDPTLLDEYVNSRVLRIGVRMKAWKDDSSPPIPGEGLRVYWSDTGSAGSVVHGSWLVYEYQRNAQMMTRWLGETNAIPRGASFVTQPWWRASFCVADLQHMAAVDQTVSILVEGRIGYDLLQTTTYLDYIELVVELAPERRIGTAHRLISNLGNFIAPYGVSPVEMLYPFNTAQAVILTSTDYQLGVREALPPSPSDQYHANPTGAIIAADVESIGPSLQMTAVTQPRATLEPYPTLTRGVLTKGILSEPAEEFDQYMLSAVGYDSDSVGITGSFWPAYEGLAYESWMQVENSTPNPQYQYVRVSGTTTFDRIKVLVKPDPLTTADLTITVEKPLATPLATATVTVAAALAAPEVGNGWHEISVPLSVAITPTAGRAVLHFTSLTTDLRPWRVATAQPTGFLYVFGYDPNGDPLLAARPNDMAAVLQCQMTAPNLSSVTTSAAQLFRGAGRCLTDLLAHAALQIPNWASFDRFVIERTVNAGLTWDVIYTGELTSGTYLDRATPWDMSAISYRVTGYRDSDRRSATSSIVAWSGAPAVAPGAAFGLIPVDNPSLAIMAYVPVSDGNLEVNWSPLNPVSTVQLHGVDYSTALRSPEQRGMSVSVVVLVEHFAMCDTVTPTPINYYGEYLAAGQRSMSPAPFDNPLTTNESLLALERESRLVLLLPGGHTRFVSLDLGGLTILTVNGVYLAEITLTDVTPPSTDPYEGE